MCQFKVSVRTGSSSDEQNVLERMGNLPHLQGSVERQGDCIVATVDHPKLNGQLSAAAWARDTLPFLGEMAPSVSMVT